MAMTSCFHEMAGFRSVRWALSLMPLALLIISGLSRQNWTSCEEPSYMTLQRTAREWLPRAQKTSASRRGLDLT